MAVPFFSSTVLAVLLAVVYSIWSMQTRSMSGECAYRRESCYFSDCYIAARIQFRERASSLGLEVVSLPIVPNIKGVRGGLTTDVAIIRGNDAKDGTGPLLLHLSAVHGVEGHAGSAIQNAILEQLSMGELVVGDSVTMVLVHAVNPYGFHFGRRWNEEGVDLNRNLLLKEGAFEKLASTGRKSAQRYDQFSSLINPNHAWQSSLDDILFMVNAVLTIMVSFNFCF